jgi:hypothetical protein
MMSVAVTVAIMVDRACVALCLHLNDSLLSRFGPCFFKGLDENIIDFVLNFFSVEILRGLQFL